MSTLKRIFIGKSVLGIAFRMSIYIMLLVYILFVAFYSSPTLTIKRYLLHPFERKSIYRIEPLFSIAFLQSITLRILPLEKLDKEDLSNIFYKRYLGSYRIKKLKILSHHKIDTPSKENIKNIVLVNRPVLEELKDIYKKEREKEGVSSFRTPFDVAPEDVNSKIVNAFALYISNGIQQRYKLPQYARYFFNVRLTFASGKEGIYKITVERVSLMPIPSESYHQLRWVISDIEPTD